MLRTFFRTSLLALLLAGYCSSVLSFFVPYLSFELNRKYIAENLCENRDKPAMHCCGLCYLNKSMQKAEKEEKNQSDNSQRFRLLVDTCVPMESIVLQTLPASTNRFICFDEDASSFHPQPATPPPKDVA
jgi:hypothetical protein